MELISTINKTWKLCFTGSLLGVLVLVLYLNGKSSSFSATRNTVQEFPLNGESEGPISSTIFEPKVVQFPPYTHAQGPMLSSSVQSKAPMWSLMANPPVQEFMHGPSSSVPTAKPPVQQSEESMFSLNAKPPSQQPIITMINATTNITIFNSNPRELEPKSRLDESVNVTSKVLEKSTVKKCNMFDGRWVYKQEENPRYDSIKCPFIEEKMNCQNNGRPDNMYEKWRWEAKDCDIPMFNGRDMMERLRNKRVIIVGDSLNRNMWESLACLLYSSIPSSRTNVQATKSHYKVLKAKDYNAIIEFYWSPFLTEYDETHKSGKRVLVLDKLSPNSKLWRGANVMVFDSAHWWRHSGKFQKWDLFQYKGKFLLEEIPLEEAYEIGMKTWAKWIKKYVDPKKTSVFFRSVSAQHNGKCNDAIQPINGNSSYINNFPKSLTNVIESVVKGLKKSKVKYLNITKLSEYRIDAHPSVYNNNPTNYQSSNRSDCSHWCLPGLPDTWNRLLYASLFFDTT